MDILLNVLIFKNLKYPHMNYYNVTQLVEVLAKAL